MQRHLLCLQLSRSGKSPVVKKYKNKEIERATNGFSMVIKTGPDGTTYKAQFENGLVCDVKRAKSSEQRKEDFLKEVQLLGRLHHRHVVRLLGFSDEVNRFLIFDHMENGSLMECLHDPLRSPLSWSIRLKIAIDVAAALEYLYYFCDPPVVHVSVNTKCVMLDSDYTAKLSDVGLLNDNTSNFTSASCSRENTEQIRKELVFQYGVLILELVTGQSLSGEKELVRWVQASGFHSSLHNMVDADLGNTYNSKELHSLLVAARLCTKSGHDSFVSVPLVHRYLQKRQTS
ncbi:protein kinase superfamily protein isoform X2 [Carex rostrata]